MAQAIAVAVTDKVISLMAMGDMRTLALVAEVMDAAVFVEELEDYNQLIQKTLKTAIMKKTLTISFMLLVGVLSTNAQTYYYKYLYTVSKSTGMKSNESFKGIYVTFTNGKHTVYESKKDGTVKSSSERPHLYQGYLNGMHVYKEQSTPNGYFPVPGWGTYTFSQDYSRMNYNTTIADFLADKVRVYERGQEPEMQNAPSHLY